jgi:hypothetical protein
VYFVPEAERIVSTGRTTQSLTLPRMTRVIGGETLFELDGSPADERTIPYRYLFGSGTAAGGGRLTAREF